MQPWIQKRNEAEREYQLTPAGLKELETQIQKHPHPSLVEELEARKTERDQRILLAGGKPKQHRRTKPSESSSQVRFSAPGEQLTSVSAGSAGLAGNIKESFNWALGLTEEEILTVRDYTGGGYQALNEYLGDTKIVLVPSHKLTAEVTEQLRKKAEVLNRALRKHEPKPVIVYRYQLLYNPDGTSKHPSLEGYETTDFVPGTVYSPNVFFSTSISDDRLVEVRETPSCWVNFQILSRSAVPVSAVAVQGGGEAEYVIPSDVKYRVVANDVVAVNSKGQLTRLVQLEEIL